METNEIKPFLETVWSTADKGYLAIWSKETKKSRFYDLSTDGQLELAIQDISQNNGRKDLYHTLGLLRRKLNEWERGTEENVIGIPGFWMDLDIAGENHKQDQLPESLEECMDFVKSWPLTPSIIVNSGGGLHVYWLFDKVHYFQDENEKEHVSRLLKNFQQSIIEAGKKRGWVFDDTTDLIRLLRIPGTFNAKNPTILQHVKILETNDIRYRIEDFKKYNSNLGKPKKAARFDVTDVLNGIPDGKRDKTLIAYASSRFAKGIDKEEVKDLILIAARKSIPPFPEKEALKCYNSALDYHNSSFVEKLNQKYFVSRDGGKTLVFYEEYDHDLEIEILKSLNFTHFKQFYQNELVVTGYKHNGEPIKKQKGVAWLAHPNRRQYEGIILRPNGDLPDYYNLWKGWPISPKKGDWSKLQEHIKYNICQRKNEVYDYVLRWMAFAVQHPNRPSEVALAMRGKRGVGKSILGNIFGKLFGQHFRHIFSSKHLVGHFNSHLRDCIFLFADEAFWAGEKSAEGVLKGLITERTINIEGKGKDIVRTKNMLHIMMASNSDWVVPAGLEERRFCILDVGDKHIQDKVYFGAIYKQMENGGYAAMLHNLLDLDLSDFDIRDVPDTQGLRDQKILSMDPQTAWWFQKLKDGFLPSKNGNWGIVETNALYENYVHTVGRAGVSHKGMQTSLGIKLKKLLPGKYPISKKIQVEKRCLDEDYNLTGIKKIRVPHYLLPPLAVCRKCFEKVANMKGYNWPEEKEITTEEEKNPEF